MMGRQFSKRTRNQSINISSYFDILQISKCYIMRFDIAARQQQRLSNIWNIYVHELNIRRSNMIRSFCDLHIKNAKQNREFGRLCTAYLLDYRRTKKLMSDQNCFLCRTEVESANTRLTCLLDKIDKLLNNLTKKKNCQR